MADSTTAPQDRELIYRHVELPAERISVSDLLDRLELVEQTLGQLWDSNPASQFDGDALGLPVRGLRVIRKALADACGYKD